MTTEFTRQEKVIYEMLLDKPMTIFEVAEKLDIHQMTARRLIYDLRNKGHIGEALFKKGRAKVYSPKFAVDASGSPSEITIFYNHGQTFKAGEFLPTVFESEAVQNFGRHLAGGMAFLALQGFYRHHNQEHLVPGDFTKEQIFLLLKQLQGYFQELSEVCQQFLSANIWDETGDVWTRLGALEPEKLMELSSWMRDNWSS